MAKMNYTQIVKVMLRAGARIDVKSRDHKSLFAIAYENNDIDLLALIMK